MSKKIKLILTLIALVIGILGSSSAIAQTGTTLTVKGAIETALSNNRSLQSDSLNISIQHEKNKQLVGQYRPQVNYTSGMEYNPAIASQMMPGELLGQPGKDLVPVKMGTKYNMRSGVEVTQAIFRKDLLIQMKATRLQTDIAKTKYAMSKEELVYRVASLYYALQTNAELIRSTESDYHNMQEVLSIAKAQYLSGLIKRIDYESLEINVANTGSQLDQLRTQYGDQLAYFNYLLGLPAAAQTILSDDIPLSLSVPADGNYLLQRNDIRLGLQMIRSKEVELKSIQAEKKPSINSYFRFNYISQFNGIDNAFNNDYLYKSSTVGISVSVPIFDGNRRRSRISMTKMQLNQLGLTSQYQKEQAEMELHRAKGILSNSQKEFLTNQHNLDLAIKVFNTRKSLYTEGVSSLVELLDAERELTRARSQYIESLINLQTGRLDVHKANGTLLTDFINSI